MPRTVFAFGLGVLLVIGSSFLPPRYPAVNGGWPAYDLRKGSEPAPIGQDADRWQLTFFDEFSDSSLDSTRWTTCYWWDLGGCTNKATNEQEWYVPDQVVVEDGKLRLIADRRTATGPDGVVYPFVSGMVTTGRSSSDLSEPPRFAFQFGYVEMRARTPSGPGLWPAFWLLPITHDSKPEIDIMEALGQEPDEFKARIHWRDESGESQKDGRNVRGPDLSEGWHTYGLEWTPTSVTWFLDGRQLWSYHDTDHLPAEPMYLIANLAVGGEYAGSTAGTEFPAEFTIDYVRVWEEVSTGDR